MSRRLNDIHSRVPGSLFLLHGENVQKFKFLIRFKRGKYPGQKNTGLTVLTNYTVHWCLQCKYSCTRGALVCSTES